MTGRSGECRLCRPTFEKDIRLIMMKTQEKHLPPRRYDPDPSRGLTAEQAASQLEKGLSNQDSTLPTKSVGEIFRDNLCTLFNLINLILAAAVVLVGSYKNLLFLGVVFCNLVIGIFQEIRAKRTIDRLSILSSVKAHVLRDGKEQEIPTDQVVLDDIMLLSPGRQVVTDGVLLEGECEVNESFVTGESDGVVKRPGDLLLAGSFLISGHGSARAEHVGGDNYISTISRGAKQFKKVNSEIMSTLKKIIKFVSIIIFPIGGILFYNQLHLSHNTLQEAVVQTVAALIGMIPEGLMLLTSTVLAVSVIRLSKHKVLVQELYCIETLARVDTLCLDKTGTLTEGCMEVADLIPLNGASPEECEAAVRALVSALPDRNATFEALAKAYGTESGWTADHTVPFSSRTKWSGASFGKNGSYVIGAGEFLFPRMDGELESRISRLSVENRVLVLGYSALPFSGRELPSPLVPVGVICLRDKIRPEAARTLRYFAEQGVDVKVISGDNVTTVSQIARRTGVPGWDKTVDLSLLHTEEEVRAAALCHTVFGRVSPVQKKQLIESLKEQGHTVAMTGDGINDVLALKEADCSVAMASGSDAARNISQLVLLNSNFDSMPRVVGEGRRSINNIQRSASLFLVKTIYSTLLAVIFLFLKSPYPFMPIQLTLISAVTIGIPALVLALEPNRARIEGDFLRNILMRAVPGAVTIVSNILVTIGVSSLFRFTPEQVSTICVLLTGFTGLLLLFRLCVPFTPMRKALVLFLCIVFGGCVVLLSGLFSLVPLPVSGVLTTLAMAAVAFGEFSLLIRLMENSSFQTPRRPRKKG